MNLDQERKDFEQAAKALHLAKRAAGNPAVDDNLEMEVTLENLFWRDENGSTA